MNHRSAVAVLAAFLAAGVAFGNGQVRLVGNMAAHFSDEPSAREAADAFAGADRPLFYGPGWEVVLDHVGFGGNYMVRFFRDDVEQWWVDWVAEAFFVSYHLLSAGHLFDPYVQLAIGTAGRAAADDDGDPVSLSVFPMVAAGLALDLNGFLIGGRIAWIPETSPPPGSDLETYPLDHVQVAFCGGIAIGGHRHRQGPHERPRPRSRARLHIHWDAAD